MARKRVDADGKPIDPMKNLGAFVAAATAEKPEEETPELPAYATVTFDDVDDPDLKGKTGKDAVDLLAQRRAEAEQARTRAQELETQLAAERQQRQIEEAVRRNMPPPKAEPQTPKVDPRAARIDELWMEGKLSEARELMSEMVADQHKDLLDKKAQEIERNLTNRNQAQYANQLAERAGMDATARLEAMGVSRADIERKASAVMSQLIHPGTPQKPNKYFYNGGPTNADNLVNAYIDLFGKPQAPAPHIAATPATPPGSAAPAPAAAPTTKVSTLSPDKKKAYDFIGERLGMKDKLIERAEARVRKNA